MKYTLIIAILFCSVWANAEGKMLKFHDGQFKIVQFTDLHLISGKDYAAKNDSTYALMRSVIKDEKPDLVVITGDIVVSAGAQKLWQQFVQPMTEAQVPFAVTFGNHDIESDMSKESVMSFLEKNPFNLTFNAAENLSGEGNCSFPVFSENGKSMLGAIYLFDSHAYGNDTLVSYYDWIRNDQIQWYRQQSAAYAKKVGKVVPALAFFHIPFPEYEYVRQQPTTMGSTVEPVCCPELNSGLFASFVEMGDVKGVFVGHDHNNDFVGMLKGIALCYGRKTGYASAYDEVLPRGARVIILDQKQNSLHTYIRTLNGKSVDFKTPVLFGAPSTEK